MINERLCVFCQKKDNLIIEKANVKVFFDKFPVTLGHTLIVPKRHISNVFELNKVEEMEIIDTIFEVKKILDSLYTPEGYNIGTNCGEVAGQTIKHCHIHIIPRYKDDVENPVGGVRGVIPHKRNYL